MFDPLRCDPRDGWVSCPDCEDGNRYFVVDPKTDERIECSKADYDNTPADFRDCETCATCGGNFWL